MCRREQYEFERKLRRLILAAPEEDRQRVTAKAYQDLFAKFPDHSVFQYTEAQRTALGRRHAAMIWPLLHGPSKILEVGCGRGDVLRALARRGHQCHGVEPSSEMITLAGAEGDVEVSFGTAVELKFPDELLDMVFSQQVLEHLHPDDVPVHLAEAYRVLKAGGVLAVETPNKHTGPQDISRGFAREADGLHLREWTAASLADEIRDAGFVKVRGLLAPPVLVKRYPRLHRWSRVPAGLKRLQDSVLGVLPSLWLRTVVGKVVGLEDVFLFARKPDTVSQRQAGR